MAQNSAQEKTEKPTSKKLSEARKKGQIPKSREVNSLAALVAGACVIYLSHGLILSHFRQLLFYLWGNGFSRALDRHTEMAVFTTAAYHFFVMASPVFFSLLLVAVLTNLLQIKGFNLSFEAIQPKLSKVNPLEGIKRLFGLRTLTELIKSILKIVVVGLAVYSVFYSEHPLFLPLVHQDLADILQSIAYLAFQIIARVGGAMLIISVLDFYYQKWQHQKDLMMTKQEVKEENKQTEGNPEIKSKLRSVQQSLARQRMMAAVPQADVVITNPTHFAVALRYDQSSMEAPRVTAKGKDRLARKIMEIARKHRVPVVRNPPLARALHEQVKLDAVIPLALYQAVAQVLAYVYQQKKT